MMKIKASTNSDVVSLFVEDGDKKGLVHMVAMQDGPGSLNYHYDVLSKPDWVDTKELFNRMQTHLNKLKAEGYPAK